MPNGTLPRAMSGVAGHEKVKLFISSFDCYQLRLVLF